ncbi:iron uptake porin [Baaleninema simplex]|uniref:iron uptake porin n=1 Tax=Baaleninema simplex TaxID=2862350 RepID=UPI0003490080|nr:iron uptake porin [Baaleninema simplex]
MSRIIWNLVSRSAGVFGVFLAASAANAQMTSVDELSDPAPSLSLDQVTSVSQLSDVQPTDWAFQALQSLVERYGCIAGYPNGTYRGNNFMTRYEFAAGLNACLDQIVALIGDGENIDVDSLQTIRRLQEEFAAELAALRGRVDGLESRVAELEANQFSTTTKLEGQVIFAAYGIAAGEDVNGNDIDKIPAFGYRTRLEFLTSFTGEDLLLTRLQASNIPAFSEVSTGYPEGDLFFSDDSGNSIEIDALNYSFPIGDNLNVVISANAGASDDFASSVNPFFDGDGNFGALSKFGTRASIFYLIEQTGIGFEYAFNDFLSLSGGYYAGEANDPTEGLGLFNGPYGAMGQLTLTPADGLEFALTYLNSYNLEMGTGSTLSNFRSFSADEFGTEMPIVSNAYGIEASWQLAENFALGGWVGYVNTQTLSTLGGTIDRGSLDSWNWAVSLAFPDVGAPGNLAGILVGQEPKVTDVSSSLERGGIDEDDDTSLHLEAFYSLQIGENLTVTPGLIWLTAPNHDDDNDDALIGVIRTTFSF